MSGRTDLAEHLTAALPAPWRVIDHDDDPTIAKPTVMLWVDRIELGVTNVFRQYTINVLVMSPRQVGGDTELEDGLEEVLEAIDLWDYPIIWRRAEYSIYADKYPAYRVTCEMNTRRHYPGDPEPAHQIQPDPKE